MFKIVRTSTFKRSHPAPSSLGRTPIASWHSSASTVQGRRAQRKGRVHRDYTEDVMTCILLGLAGFVIWNKFSDANKGHSLSFSRSLHISLLGRTRPIFKLNPALGRQNALWIAHRNVSSYTRRKGPRYRSPTAWYIKRYLKTFMTFLTGAAAAVTFLGYAEMKMYGNNINIRHTLTIEDKRDTTDPKPSSSLDLFAPCRKLADFLKLKSVAWIACMAGKDSKRGGEGGEPKEGAEGEENEEGEV
uniref:FGENESH: predicted gene_10.81 protein n=1 Tax=Rhodotorula toruloides TaxID=5286 RepID=A0A0K3CKC0_RHOTO